MNLIIVATASLYLTSILNAHLPHGFTYVTDPRFVYAMQYATANNFVGKPIRGYHKRCCCILTLEAAQALSGVQDDLDKYNKQYHIKVFDAYRPQRAVDHFKEWSLDISDQAMKKLFYPDIDKATLLDPKNQYIAEKSGHSRGSTVDLTICIQQHDGSYKELDMGTPFDFFDKKSHTDSQLISQESQKNRQLLTAIL